MSNFKKDVDSYVKSLSKEDKINLLFKNTSIEAHTEVFYQSGESAVLIRFSHATNNDKKKVTAMISMYQAMERNIAECIGKDALKELKNIALTDITNNGIKVEI